MSHGSDTSLFCIVGSPKHDLPDTGLFPAWTAN